MAEFASEMLNYQFLWTSRSVVSLWGLNNTMGQHFFATLFIPIFDILFICYRAVDDDVVM